MKLPIRDGLNFRSLEVASAKYRPTLFSGYMLIPVGPHSCLIKIVQTGDGNLIGAGRRHEGAELHSSPAEMAAIQNEPSYPLVRLDRSRVQAYSLLRRNPSISGNVPA